jgi:hypothetical protein
MNFESMKSKIREIEGAMMPPKKSPLDLLRRISLCLRGEHIEFSEQELAEFRRYAMFPSQVEERAQA